MTSKSNIVHVALNTQDLDADEAERDKLVAAILKMGPASALAMGSAIIQGQITAVGAAYTAYKAATSTAGASGKQYEADLASAAAARVLSNKSLRLLATLLESGAVTPDQVTESGMDAYAGKPPLPPLVSPIVNVKLGPKGSGRATAVAHETGVARGDYNAQVSTDAGTPVNWTDLVGGGKTRKLTGKPGTSVWVHFALRQGQNQSEWSTPTLVTFP